jgi:ABC-type nickel/cobalt efflux system permease component RcnA
MAAPGNLVLEVALLSAALLGFRHGFDYDHVAAISDIAATEPNTRRAMKLGLTYALGHAATVAVLGIAVILFQRALPIGADSIMEHATGLTLLVLGIFVLWTSFFRPHPHPHAHPPRTRMVMLVNAFLWLGWKIQRLLGRKAERRQLFANGIGAAPAFVVGIVHGLGAETPTQLMVFLLAANLGGVGKGLLGLAMFIAGMLLMNTLMCAAVAGIVRFSLGRASAAQWVAGLSGAYSIIVGLVFLAGTSSVAAVLGR